MYAWYRKSTDELAALASGKHDPVRFHRGDERAFFRRHQRHTLEAKAGSRPLVTPYLADRICDGRAMRLALDHLRRFGGRAPGPDGQRIDDLDNHEAWDLSRSMSTALNEGDYEPGPSREKRIPKPSNPEEFRTLRIQNMRDRIVAGAARLILEPVVAPRLSPTLFGGVGQGVEHALATAVESLGRADIGFMVCVDLRRFYDRIPHSRMIDALRAILPGPAPDELVDLISRISHAGSKRGVRQGNPLSPLLARVFAHHFIARPWAHRHPDRPLIIYADDLLVPAGDAEDADGLYEDLARIARSAGVPIKESREQAIWPLGAETGPGYLGFELRRPGQEVELRLKPRALDRLAERLMGAHEKPDPPLAADQTVLGWLNFIGPTYAMEDRGARLDRVETIAGELGFAELPPHDELTRRWSAAYARWRRRLASGGTSSTPKAGLTQGFEEEDEW